MIAHGLGVPTIAFIRPGWSALPKNRSTLPRLIDIDATWTPVNSSPGRRMPSSVTLHGVGSNMSFA